MDSKAFISVSLLVILIFFLASLGYLSEKLNNSLLLTEYFKKNKFTYLEQKYIYDEFIYDEDLLVEMFGSYIKDNIRTGASQRNYRYETLNIEFRLQRKENENQRMYTYIIVRNRENNFILQANGYPINHIFDDLDLLDKDRYIDNLLNNSESLEILNLANTLNKSEEENLNLKGIYSLSDEDLNIGDRHIELDGILIIDKNIVLNLEQMDINIRGLVISNGQANLDASQYEFDQSLSYYYGKNLPGFINFDFDSIKIY